MDSSESFFYAKEYHKLWEKSQCELKVITKNESILLKEKVQKDRDTALKALQGLYLLYVKAVNTLDECYDQIVHPQKRLLIRKVMDACLCRVLELKHSIVDLDMADFNYLDTGNENNEVLLNGGETNIPRFYVQDRKYDITQRKANLKKVLLKLGCYSEEKLSKPMTYSQAVLIIQTHERARQGRLRFEFMNEIRKLREKGKQPAVVSDDKTTMSTAAVTIQKIWRGYWCRKLFNKRKIKEMMLIGMILPSVYQDAAQKRSEEISKLRHQIQSYHDARYNQVVPGEKVLLHLRKGRMLKKKYISQIRDWYNNERKEKKKFPDIPSKEKGGSAVLFGIKQKKISSAKSSKTVKGKKEKGKKAKSKEKGKETDTAGVKLRPSRFRSEIVTGISEFHKIWMDRDESSNFEQAHDMQLITRNKLKNVKMEIRTNVDSLMRLELNRLKAAVERDRAQRRRKGSKKKAGKSRGGGSSKGHRGWKSGKKVRRKKEKDLTPDRTLDSLFEELVANGIIKNYPEVPLSSFLGHTSLIVHKQQNAEKKPKHTIGDVRKLLKEYCILPIGSAYVHNNAPFVRSLLIAGPHGSGKHMLLHAICTELGAYLFDISHVNIADKYPGKTGLTMLIHLVNKMSRLLQPSIIFVGNAEKTFLKRVPKNDLTDPKRLKKELPKLVKSIGAEDQMMVIGISNCPWESDQKGLASAYNKMIIIPRPDYATLSSVWNNILYSYNALNQKFDCMAMARMCDGFTIGVVIKIIREVLTCKRLLTLKVRPLKHIEFFKLLSAHDPVYWEEEDAFVQWFSKCPLARKKQKFLDTIEMLSIKEKKKGGKNGDEC